MHTARSDESGRPLTRWDGISKKINPVTGEETPDESARLPVERYLNPRKAEWLQADYIVGNPPFIGDKAMRRALGDGYVDAVRATWPEVPESADLKIARSTTKPATSRPSPSPKPPPNRPSKSTPTASASKPRIQKSPSPPSTTCWKNCAPAKS